MKKFENGDFEGSVANKKIRSIGGRRKAHACEVRKALFHWLIDIRSSLKARLPKSLFILQAKKLYEDWLQQHPETPKRNCDSQTSGSKVGNKNMGSPYAHQISAIQFPETTASSESRIT